MNVSAVPDAAQQALCTICGQLRTFKRARNHRRENVWLHEPVDADWGRKLGDLKCSECARITTHALLYPAGYALRNHAELIHLIAVGWWSKHAPEGAAERIRERYRQSRIPNPYLHHLWWASDEQEARAAGKSEFSAICGESIRVAERTPEQRQADYFSADDTVPCEVGDEEYQDPETGLLWTAQSCVDCLKRHKKMALEYRQHELRERLLLLVTENLDSPTVERLLATLKRSGGGGR